LGVGGWAQPPNPQSPIPNPQIFTYFNEYINLNTIRIYYLLTKLKRKLYNININISVIFHI
jgi:hypothetical protein